MEKNILDTMPTEDKKGFFYLVELKNENGKNLKKWVLPSEMDDELLNKKYNFCLRYVVYDVWDCWLMEKRTMCRDGAIFESVNDFENWKKSIKYNYDFLELRIIR